jgi:hypothetical protein
MEVTRCKQSTFSYMLLPYGASCASFILKTHLISEGASRQLFLGSSISYLKAIGHRLLPLGVINEVEFSYNHDRSITSLNFLESGIVNHRTDYMNRRSTVRRNIWVRPQIQHINRFLNHSENLNFAKRILKIYMYRGDHQWLLAG